MDYRQSTALLDHSLKNIGYRKVPKLSKTLNILQAVKERNEKAIIFTEFRSMQVILKREILEQFNLNAQIINGLTSNRQYMVDQFNQSSGFNVLILSPRAAGTGLTITGANHVIHYTRWWNPAVENQATDRVYRIGQEKDVHVYYPIVKSNQAGNTFEKVLDELIEEKKSLANNVIVPSEGQDLREEVLARLPELVS